MDLNKCRNLRVQCGKGWSALLGCHVPAFRVGRMRRRIGQVRVRAGDWTKRDPPGRAAQPRYFDCISVAALNSALKSAPVSIEGSIWRNAVYMMARRRRPKNLPGRSPIGRQAPLQIVTRLEHQRNARYALNLNSERLRTQNC